jgi:hypothetical protein
MTAYLITPHHSQYDYSPYTAANGCTWTSITNGAQASTGRYINPDTVHSKVKHWEETNPQTPGWSLPDAVLACHRLGVPFADRSGDGWGAITGYHDAGYALLVQGDSDQFGNNVCSGAFNGDHCIGLHPNKRVVGGRRQRYIDDPICSTGRWEYEDVLKRYAQKLDSRVRFGQFLDRVRAKPSKGHAAVKEGTYATYSIDAKYRPHREGSIQTGGFSADAITRSVRPQGPIFVEMKSGAYKDQVIYRYATGVSYTD